MFISSCLFLQRLEGMNGAGGNLIKNLLHVALRSNHTVKSFWFWSTPSTLKSWQFSPAQARFHCCAVLLPRAGTFFLLRTPGEICTTRQPGASRISCAGGYACAGRHIRSLLSTNGVPGLAPSLSHGCWDGRETAWAQHWACSKR